MSVIIIGCGITGPVLAMLLKQKGFEPVIYEAHRGTAPGGLTLGISPNTFPTLDIIGLADEVIKQGVSLEEMRFLSAIQNKELWFNDLKARTTGWPFGVISRAVYTNMLCDAAQARGIPVHFDKKLVNVEQSDDRVTAIFEDGTTAEADILVGCDGIHSAVQASLFGPLPVNFMGIVQIGGDAEIPESLRSPAPCTMYQVFGDGCAFLAIPYSETRMAWIATMAEPVEAREDWRTVSIADAAELIKTIPATQWSVGPCKEIIANTAKLIKYGIYERPIASVWHKSRVVLCGDAAHPTSPHIGQGANQAVEDCYQLTRLLMENGPLTNENIERAFTEFEKLRMPIVTSVIEAAKREGENRVVKGEEACKKRDDFIEQGRRRELLQRMVKGAYVGRNQI